jgi:hypothetical protein
MNLGGYHENSNFLFLFYITLPHQKIVGLYQTWFPGVDFSKAQAIRATSASATLSGEAISGGLNYDRLVFGLGQPIQSD